MTAARINPAGKQKGANAELEPNCLLGLCAAWVGIVLEEREGGKLCGNGNTETKWGRRVNKRTRLDLPIGWVNGEANFFTGVAYCFSPGRCR